MEPLDFTDAQEVSFEAIPKGTYDATVFSAEMAETSGSGKLGVRPMLKVQFRITESDEHEYGNRRVFTQFVIPPREMDGQPYEHYGNMMGNIMSFYKAIGFTEKEIKKWKGLPDPDSYTGRACRVAVIKEKYEGDWVNRVKNVKPEGSDDESATAGLGQLA
jgi:hypothetical protein